MEPTFWGVEYQSPSSHISKKKVNFHVRIREGFLEVEIWEKRNKGGKGFQQVNLGGKGASRQKLVLGNGAEAGKYTIHAGDS